MCKDESWGPLATSYYYSECVPSPLELPVTLRMKIQ